eukprot:5542169-Amphidinium_carterae.1
MARKRTTGKEAQAKRLKRSGWRAGAFQLTGPGHILLQDFNCSRTSADCRALAAANPAAANRSRDVCIEA